MVGRMSGATTTWNFKTWSYNSETDYDKGIGNSASELSGLTVNPDYARYYARTDGSGYIQFLGSTIHVHVTKGQIVTFYLQSIDNHQAKYTVGGNTNGGSIEGVYGEEVASSFLANANGEITITSQSGNNYCRINSIVREDAPTFSFEGHSYTANIQDYNQFAEPVLTNTTGVDATFTSSNEKIAKLLWDKNVVFRGSGIVTITATVTYKGIEFSDSYDVTVSDPGAWPVIEGNTCTLSGVGRLNPQSASVPGLTMEFGNISLTDPNKNTTIVQTFHGNLYASTIDQNGYRHVWWGSNNLPHQGTFYVFKPTVNGTLKVWVSCENSGHQAYLLESSDPNTKISTTDLGVAGTNSPNQVTATLTAGKTYYLCTGNVENNWTNVLLFNKFTYEPSFKFSANSATVANGTTSYSGISLEGVSGAVTYTTECYGNIASATVDNSGHITNITYNDTDQGGAVVVHASCEAGTATYVLTVAYKQHLWDFTDTYSSSKPHGDVLTFDPYPSILTTLNNNNTDWIVTNKVRTYTNSVLTYLNGPVYANATAIDGTNADYNSRTAGIVITAGSKSFGSNAILPNSYYNDGQTPGEDKDFWEGVFKTDYYSELLGIETSAITGASGITLQKGAKLTIPDLKIGQYVRIKWRRHAPGKGDKVLLTNLSDLKWTPMDYVLVNNNRMKRVGRGYHVFRVTADGDISFQVDDDGWLNIYSIEVSDNFKDDNSWNDKVGSKANTMDTELNFPSPNALVYESGTEHSWTTSGNNVYGQSNISLFYLLEGLESKGSTLASTLQGTKIENSVTKNANNQPVFTSTFKPIGHGQLVAVAEGFTYRVADDVFDAGDIEENEHIYWLDLERTLITVNETGSTTQTYPYTWDFTRLSQRSKLRLSEDTEYWSGDATNGYTPTAAYQTAFTENTEITTMDDPWERDHNITTGEDYYGFAEYDGIGFNTNPENGYSTSLTSIKITTDGTGLVIGNGSADAKAVTLNIPKVDAGYTVYVRVKENNNASVTVGGESNVGYTDSQTGEKVYTFTTSEKTDVPVAVKNAEVKKIAVTKMTKTCWFKNGNTNEYYNTDSHNKPIDYNLTEYFTGNAVKAYTVATTATDKDGAVNAVVMTPIVKAPENQGYIVSTEYDSDPNEASASDANLYKRPLFVTSTLDHQTMTPAENRMETAYDTFLKPHVTKGGFTITKDDEDYYYVLTNRYFDIYTKQWFDSEVPGFYRLQPGDSEELSGNRAYLVLPKSVVDVEGSSSNGVKQFIPLFDFEGELVDAIDMISAENTENGIDMKGTFYTLQGMKVNGFPRESGIYIQNGKKVIVK